MRPRISLCGARAAYVGPSLGLAPHRNAAVTVAIALDAPFALTLDGPAGRIETIAGIAVIPAGARHHVVAGGPMAFVYLDALAGDVPALMALDLTAARRRLVRAVESGSGGDVVALYAAFGLPAGPPADPRLAAVAQRMEWRPDAFCSAAEAARAAGLSASRFQALFRRALGAPFRRYRTWRRMAVVAERLAGGASLTAAAHEAGFASSAHLSAAFRAMFGISPSALLAGGASIEIAPAAIGDRGAPSSRPVASQAAPAARPVRALSSARGRP